MSQLLQRASIAFAFLFFATPLLAQDTTVVQTLTFDSITARRGWFEFPDESHTWRKILMYYTLKCDPQTTADSYDCGEWDYLTYSNVWDHTGQLDSTALEHPWFLVGNSDPAQVDYSTNPAYSWHQSEQTELVITGTNSETLDTLGSGSTQLALGGTTPDARHQYVWTASELTAAGMMAGDIDRIMLNVDAVGPMLRNFTVRMRTTAGGIAPTFEEDNWTEVYHLDTEFPATGWQALNLTNSFSWNGISNLLVEFSYDNSGASSSNNMVAADDLGSTVGISASGSDHYVWFDADNRVGVPTNTMAPAISDEITVAFWQYGDPSLQPQSDFSFEALDSDGNRVLTVHLPWGNSRVYWDAGNVGGSYDRIDKAANNSDFLGQWNHWAFTKDANTGTMKMFLNGTEWHSGNGRTRLMDDIATFNIGSNGNGASNYDGGMDEFCVFSKALTEVEIEELMYEDIAASHPQYANLVAYYQFNEGAGVHATDAAAFSGDAALLGAPQWRDFGGHELFRNPTTGTLRPQVIFASGDYTTSTNTTTVTDTMELTPNTVVYYQVDGNDVVGVDTLEIWITQQQYTYDPSGAIIDSTLSANDNSIINSTLNYYGEPFELINRYEIGRFITPYGIGLDLGDEGTTWIYDVTDYAWLLHDSVDLNSGNNQELIDLKFVMIEGTPARDMVQFDRIWGERGSHSYTNLDDDNDFSAATMDLHPEAENFMVRTRLTGHGHNSNDGSYPHCCEWKDNEHYLYVNDAQVAAWHIWQATECANNPVYPQGGTWPGAREGWCPGDVVKNFDFDITDHVSGSTVTLDYDLTPVPSNNLGMGGGSYVTAMQLMQYGPYNFNNDVEVYDILTPTDNDYYSRDNPFCNDPRIVLRNGGGNDLTYCNILYGVVGGAQQSHEWFGNLGSMDTAHVSLPIGAASFWDGDGSQQFFVRVELPNNEPDENEHNNTYQSHYELPEFYEENFVIELRMNNYASENRLTVTDANENIVLERDNMENNELYFDTLNLAPGCYTLLLDDTGLDGLSYWADPTSGNGYMRLRDQSGGFLKFFENEFGGYIKYAFSVGLEVTVDEIVPERNVGIYPNPTEGRFTVEAMGYNSDFRMEVLNSLGQVVATDRLAANVLMRAEVDLSDQAPGLYMVRLHSASETVTKTVLLR